MKSKTYTAIILTLLILGLFAPFSIKPANADGQTYNVTISDSSVNQHPEIFSKDGTTFTVTQNFTGSITVTASNIVIDGAGYTMQASGSIDVYLNSVTNVTVVNLKINGGTHGFYSGSASSCVIANNTLTNVSNGVYSDTGGMGYCNITGNSIQSGKGVYFMNGNGHNRITSNNLTCGDYGIELFSSDNIAIDNFIRGTYSAGFYLYKESGIANNVIHDNTVFGYGGKAIEISRSSGAQIYHNNFIAPTGYSASLASANSWDNGTYGNYFSSADHTDANSDGFVDSALTIASNNVDNHPLSHYFGLNVINMTVVGSGSTNRISGLNYERAGDHVVVTQTPSNDGEFYNWILDGENVTSNTITVEMNTNHSLTAVFKQVYYTLTVIQPLDGAVCVSGNSSNLINGTEIVQGIGTTLSVQALPVTGTQFYYWVLDGQSDATNPKTVTFNGNHTLQAIFLADTVNMLPDGADWPMLMGDPAQTGYTAENGALDDTELWSFEAPAAIKSSPAIVDGMVYFGADDGYIYAVNEATGKHAWNCSLSSNAITTSPAVAEGKVFVGIDRNLIALDAVSGELLWNASIGTSGSATSPTIADDTVYVGVGNQMYAFSVTQPNGEIRWTYTAEATISSPAAVADGKVYFAATNLFVLNAETNSSEGELLWYYNTTSAACPSLIVADGLLIAGDTAGQVYAFNATTDNNTALWTYNSGSNTPMLAAANGIVYVARNAMMSDVLTALNATTTNAAGEELWGQMGMFDSPYAAPIIANDVVYFGMGSWLYGYNATSSISEGNPQQIWGDNGMTVKSPMAVANGILFVTTNEKYLYAYAPSTKVIFAQTDLPAGVNWSVTLDNTTITTALHTITFGVLQTGAHSYSVSVPSGYVANVTSGTVDVEDTMQVIAISYTLPTYDVTFTETGLAEGTEWNITLNGATQTSTADTITFTGYPNGEYTYTVGVPTSYLSNTETDTVTIADANATQSIVFTGIINANDTTTNDSYIVQIGGNVTVNQFANMTITPYQNNGTTVIKFNITGPDGNTGFCNLTIPKAAIPYGTKPVVYIDSVEAAGQSCTEDATNYYITYTTHFSTHQVEIKFSTPTSPTPSPTSTPTPQPTQTPNSSSSPTPTTTPSPTTNPTPTPKPTHASPTPYFMTLLVVVLLSAAFYCMVQRKKHQATEA